MILVCMDIWRGQGGSVLFGGAGMDGPTPISPGVLLSGSCTFPVRLAVAAAATLRLSHTFPCPRLS